MRIVMSVVRVVSVFAIAMTARWSASAMAQSSGDVQWNGVVSDIVGTDGVPYVASEAEQGGCFPRPDPPTIDCATNDTRSVSAEQFAGGSNTICSSSDSARGDGSFAADNFFVLAAGEIRGVTWWGAMVDFDASLDCPAANVPVSGDDWTIRYYLSENGLPGTLIKEFLNVGPNVAGGTFSRTDTNNPMNTGIGPLIVYESTYTFAAVDRIAIDAIQEYWVEIVSNNSTSGCTFCWMVSDPSWDLDSLFHSGLVTVYDRDANNAETDVNAYDRAMCQDFCPQEALPAVPDVTLERVGLAEQGTGCCTFKYIVKSRNPPQAGPITEFWLAIDRGDGDGRCGEDLTEITPPAGWTVDFCKPWTINGQAIYRFTGGSISEGNTAFGSITVQVNDEKENVLDATNTVPPFGIRAWAGQPLQPDELTCTLASGPLAGEAGSFSDGSDGICTIHPIPSTSALGKAALVTLLIAGGVALVMRSRRGVIA